MKKVGEIGFTHCHSIRPGDDSLVARDVGTLVPGGSDDSHSLICTAQSTYSCVMTS